MIVGGSSPCHCNLLRLREGLFGSFLGYGPVACVLSPIFYFAVSFITGGEARVIDTKAHRCGRIRRFRVFRSSSHRVLPRRVACFVHCNDLSLSCSNPNGLCVSHFASCSDPFPFFSPFVFFILKMSLGGGESMVAAWTPPAPCMVRENG